MKMTPTCVTGHLILLKIKPSTEDSGSICKQNTHFATSEILIDSIVIWFFSYKY